MNEQQIPPPAPPTADARSGVPKSTTGEPASPLRASAGGGASTLLFLVRHGRVHNPDEVAYGHLPRYGLDAEGRLDAERAAALLAAHQIVAIVVSPLLRARQTARVIRRVTGEIPLHQDVRLRESELARFWQGLPWRELTTVHADLYATFETTPSLIETGETMAAMASRMRSACLSAARRYPGHAVALVSHRDPILALRFAVTDGDFDALNRTPCQPGSITEVRVEDRRLTYVGYTEP
ncbi:MAG: histidine phosphatase family protein [Dehalococcoidia bacterium]